MLSTKIPIQSIAQMMSPTQITKVMLQHMPYEDRVFDLPRVRSMILVAVPGVERNDPSRAVSYLVGRHRSDRWEIYVS